MMPLPDNHLQQLAPDAQERLAGLYERAASESGLTATDFYSVNDLLELSGLGHVESLHALLLAMFVALNDGSRCVAADVPALTLQLADLEPESAGPWAARIVADLEGGAFDNLVGRSVQDNKPLVLQVHGSTGFLYFQKFLKSEQVAWGLLQQRLHGDPIAVDRHRARQVVTDVVGPLAAGTLNPGQRLALALALLQPLTIISGGPGTGKTSIVGSLLRCLVRLGCPGERIALAAPTGRAAQRLTDALQAGLDRLPMPLDSVDSSLKERAFKATTLHQLLAYSPRSGAFRRHEENPLPYDLLIVDEASMVGLTLLAQLLRALPRDARLVLLGDKDQLPSVEAGSWLAHLLPPAGPPHYSGRFLQQVHDLFPGLALPPPSEARPVDVLAILRENYRSEPRIQELAAAVNRQDARALDSLPRFCLAGASPPSAEVPVSFADATKKRGCWLLEPAAADAGWLRTVVQQWATHHYLTAREGISFREQARACELPANPEALGTRDDQLERLFAIVEGARILALVREGSWGAAGINQVVAQLVRPPGERGLLFPGAVVLLTRNDPARQLFNGDVGVVLATASGELRVVFARRGGFVSLSGDALPAYEHAFALTVHKSQGSEYGEVLLVLPPEGARHLLTKELIYTGLTRARCLAVLVGTRQRFQEAIARTVRRVSGVIRPAEAIDT